MVSIGAAWVYRKYYQGSDYYDAENDARDNHRGLWHNPKPLPPWEWRQGVNNNNNAPAVKLSKTKICHAKGSTYYNRVKNYRAFETIGGCLKFGRLPKR